MTDVNGNIGGNKKSGVVEVDGLQQTAFLLASVTNTNLRKNLKQFHSRQIGVITQYAERYFEEGITRPNESGARQHRRETGNFSFGRRSGGAFVGVSIDDPANDQYGFGYPDVAKADRKTNFVWRSLEFGLAPHPSAIRSEFGPIGSAKFPSKFTFLPFSGQQGILQPRGRGSGPSGALVTPRGRILKRVKAPGIAPRLFITRAFNDVAANIVDGYRTVVGQTYKDFT